VPARAATFAFAHAARVYWLTVFPPVCRELAHWRARAERIPHPALRARALAALLERGNMEGAAAFATFVPAAARRSVVSATVAFQAAYNHLDALSESWLGAHDAVARSRLAHGALLAALGGDTQNRPLSHPRADPDWRGACGDDGGYLAELVAACRSGLAELPGWPVARAGALRAAARVVEFQTWQAGGDAPTADGTDPAAAPRTYCPAGVGRPGVDAPADGTDPAAAPRTRPAGAAGPDRAAASPLAEASGPLHWWELAGAAGSSLGVHALIAAAADPALASADVRALDAAYFPSIGALHTMLDHLVDRDEDRAIGQRNLIDCYASPAAAERRLCSLARAALTAARALAPAPRHELIVAAMAGFYLAHPAAHAPQARDAARTVAAELGGLGTLARGVFATRRLVAGCRPAGTTISRLRLAGVPRRVGRRLAGTTTESQTLRPLVFSVTRSTAVDRPAGSG
jgi:tetraprenyl-beta-curcumene synthase